MNLFAMILLVSPFYKQENKIHKFGKKKLIISKFINIVNGLHDF